MRAGFAVGLLLMVVSNAAWAATVPPQRRPADYPAACMPPPGETKATQKVVVIYDISRKGAARNVRVTESTDPCFNEAAVAAVRGWRFEPVEKTDVETTFTFVLNGASSIEDQDASPLTRVPPKYPERCLRAAKDTEAVLIEFDVTPEGTTTNIRTLESTNSCLNKEAERAVSKWRYRPKLEGGAPVLRKGVQTTLVFQLTSSYSPDLRIRGPVLGALLRAQRKERNGKPAEALIDLEEIEADYGDSFSKAELSAFHLVRGRARLALKDYAGALDDFRVVQRYPSSPEIAEAVAEVIPKLEAAAAAEAAKRRPASEAAPSGETPTTD